jgi:type II secretory pathway component PulK
MTSKPTSSRRGLAMVMVVTCLIVFAIVFGVLTKLCFAERSQARAEERRLRAVWLAESGLERAWSKLSASKSYAGETWEIPARTLHGPDGAVVRIAVETVAGKPEWRRVTATADTPREGTSRARQTRSADIDLNAFVPGDAS